MEWPWSVPHNPPQETDVVGLLWTAGPMTDNIEYY